MAQVPEQEAPSLAPQIGAPDDYQHIQSSPANFGATIAQGAQQFGAGATQAGKFWGQVQTDDALNGAMGTTNQILDNFRSLRGADALNAQAATNTQIDAAFKKARDNLGSADQQYQFDQTARTYRERYVAGLVSSHANQQAVEHAGQTNKASMELALNGVATMADDPDQVQAFRHDARAAAIRQVQVEGNSTDPDLVQDAIRKADQAVAKTQIEAVGAKDPARALKLVDGYKTDLGTLYEPLAAQFRTQAAKQSGIAIGQQAIAQAGNTAPTQSINDAILQQESGGNNAVPVSANGAVGPSQILPATFAQYAKPGEDINNPADNKTVGNRIIDDLKSKYPDDPARVAVGYFSGSGNVAPPGNPTPWVNDAKDANGKSVSSYVSDVTNRVGGPQSMKASAVEHIMRSTDDPDVQRQALSYVNEQYTAAQIASANDAAAKKAANDQSVSGYTTRFLKNDTSGIIQEIANDPHIGGAERETLFAVAEKHAMSDATLAPQLYGPGFNDALKAIVAPPNDPGRITDPMQLYRRAVPGGDLNLAGAKVLEGMIQKGRSAEGVGENTAIDGAISYAKRQLSFEDPSSIFPQKDPKGMDSFNMGFTPSFFKYYNEGRANGKSTAELLDRKSIDQLIAPFKRSPADTLRDQIESGAELPQTGGVPPPPPTPKSQAEFNALPSGAHFINPADGRQMIKK